MKKKQTFNALTAYPELRTSDLAQVNGGKGSSGSIVEKVLGIFIIKPGRQTSNYYVEK